MTSAGKPARPARAARADGVATRARILHAARRRLVEQGCANLRTGSGAWDAMPPARRTAVAAAVRNVKGWRDALFNETVSHSALAVPAPQPGIGHMGPITHPERVNE